MSFYVIETFATFPAKCTNCDSTRTRALHPGKHVFVGVFFLEWRVIKIDVQHNIREAATSLAKLKKDLQDKAVNAALNKTADKARAEMTRQVTAEFNVKAKDVRSQTQVRRANGGSSSQIAVLYAFPKRRGHRSRNVMLFDARPAPGKTKKRVNVQLKSGQWITVNVPVGGGITVKIKKNGPRKLIEGAFIANKGRTVFRRTGDGRKIKAVETIDVPSMFSTWHIQDKVVRKIKADFPVELQRAVAMYLAKG